MIRPLLALIFLATQLRGADPPRIVGTPPVDAGRGLIRISPNEIRHYPGKGGSQYLRTIDNGETWEAVDLPPTFPPATCLAKEAPSIRRNPNTGEFLRVEPLYRGGESEGVHLSLGGIDGNWRRVEDVDNEPILPGGILRSPIWVNGGKRLLLPGHGGGCWTWYSDDQGMTWERSNKINSPAHQIGGVHRGTRWNHGMVEATIVELKDGKLWIVARTAQDQHYESYSSDFGETWSEAMPSRFWGTITMPTFHRMDDGRLLFIWSNTTPLPEVAREKKRGGEDVFTNRDTIHAAISEDDGKSWIGFREIILDEHRNNADYAVTKGSNDRGKHQSEIVQLDDNRVLLTCGQHPLHRKLMIMDVGWLYEKERRSDLAKDGNRDWSTHQYIDKIAGHCGYNRTPGAQVSGKALRILRVDNPALTNQNQGATWNFPAGSSGSLEVKFRLEKGGAGIQIALADRWFNPVDDSIDQFANFVLRIDERGRAPDGEQLLTPGETHSLSLRWTGEGLATVSIDGVPTSVKLRRQHDCLNGISYLHLYNPAIETDPNGFSVFSTQSTVD